VTGIVRVLKRPAILRVGAPGGAQIQLPAPMVTAPGEGDADLLLDTLAVQPVGAFSLQKLRSDYAGSAIRVRRSSDNAEQDIGFSGILLNTTALTSFCGAGNGFVVTWYGQNAGTAFNVSNVAAAEQGLIVSGGVLVTRGGKPTIQCGSGPLGLGGPDILGGTSAEIMACVVSAPIAGSGQYHTSFASNVGAFHPFIDLAYYWDVGGGAAPNRVNTGAIAVPGTTTALTFINSVAQSRQEIWRAGTLVASDATGHSVATDRFWLNYAGDTCSEALIFNSASALTQRAAISTSQTVRWV
jgi:hypothetical protein